MEREWYWRGALIALITLGSLYLLVPSWYYFRLPAETRNDPGVLEAELPSWAPQSRLNLGLDLQGGIHLVMEVDIDAALSARAASRGHELEDHLTRNGITGATTSVVGRTRVRVTVPEGQLAQARTLLSEFQDMEQTETSGNTLTFSFRREEIRALRDGAVDQSIRAIRNRIDRFGVTEPVIARRGERHILVQLPGFKDPEQAKSLIGRTAQLEFRIVDDNDRSVLALRDELPPGVRIDYEMGSVPFLRGSNQIALQSFVQDRAPDGREYVLGRVEESREDADWRTYTVSDRADLTGEYLTDARVQFSDDIEQRPHVSLTFSRRGAELFERLTGDNVGKRMAIVLDGVVDSAPVIQTRIAGGRAQISLGGMKSMQEILQDAQNLSIVLKAGALPAPVTIAEQRSVGASLGPELIRSGATAAVVGTLLVLFFMALYYRGAGVVADLALILNGLLILAGLALFGASLTMPGIAGMVLTLGMAVDANVIINERIREELREGKSPRSAVAKGYDKAFSAIIDANVTTLFAGIVLLQYGTGPIRGFAVTLIIGIIASMFTAIVVTRWFADLLVTKRPDRLSI